MILHMVVDNLCDQPSFEPDEQEYFRKLLEVIYICNIFAW